MGRKKTKRAAVKKVYKTKLEKSFSCPFCNHESTIECKLDRSRQIGTASCRICSAGYQTVINYLSEPVDVYSEWIDAIESQDQKRLQQQRTAQPSPPPPSAATEKKKGPGLTGPEGVKKTSKKRQVTSSSESEAVESEADFSD